ncbi:amino acid adenylation domain-containing protein [Nocardiopsis listeri]|uniref:amino acid adenylation domain-containing protein n=1 Tax=Nocardiopsis listeri TaxID=53440 RepID=UPI00082B5864|nr:amino acid adenylation domain-containing protein [Nocardiopsis listeri]
MKGESALASDLRRAAEQHGDRVAVIHEGGVLTYERLTAAVEKISVELAAYGVTDGDCVAWHGHKSAAAVAAVHGILRAGAGYVPLDASAPRDRNDAIINGQKPRALLADGPTREVWERTDPDLRWSPITVPRPITEDLWFAPLPDPRSSHIVDIAYVLHTSGSTGRPKGVVHTHASARAFLDWAVSELELTGDDVLVNSAPLHFDLSILDLFGACRVGAAVAVLPPSVAPLPAGYAEFCRDAGATVWYTVPSTLAWLTRRGTELVAGIRSLRVVALAGEVVRPPDVAALRAAIPAIRVWNLYGPTETNVCTYHEVRSGHPLDEPVPIGRALPEVELSIVDERRRPVPEGEVGELLVRGDTVMAGYIDERDDRDAFVATPDGRIWYATGDNVRIDAHGDLVFIGRNDQQIKSRGHRIELGEVEEVITGLPGVGACVAVAAPDPLFGNTITVFVQPAPSAQAEALTLLAQAVRTALPPYMVPQRIISLTDTWPTLSNGKADRRRLSELALSSNALRGEGVSVVW